MNETVSSTDPAFFEAKYATAEGHDPWRFATDPYEQARYRTLIDVLGSTQFELAFEPGCSIGAFTRHLARRCHRIDAIDVAPTAIAEATRRNADLAGVVHQVGALPRWANDRPRRYDLVCLVEVGYYFDADRLAGIATFLADDVLTDESTVLAGHWTGVSPDHVLPGASVHEVLDRALRDRGFIPAFQRQHHDGFVVDRWSAAAGSRRRG